MNPATDYIIKTETLEKGNKRCDLILKTEDIDFVLFTLSGVVGSVMRKKEIKREGTLTCARNAFQLALDEKLKENWRIIPNGKTDLTWFIEKRQKAIEKQAKKKSKGKPASVKTDRNITFDL